MANSEGWQKFVCIPFTYYILAGLAINIHIVYGTFGRGITTLMIIYTVGSRSLRKLINYLAKKRKFLFIHGGLSELNSK